MPQIYLIKFYNTVAKINTSAQVLKLYKSGTRYKSLCWHAYSLFLFYVCNLQCLLDILNERHVNKC